MNIPSDQKVEINLAVKRGRKVNNINSSIIETFFASEYHYLAKENIKANNAIFFCLFAGTSLTCTEIRITPVTS